MNILEFRSETGHNAVAERGSEPSPQDSPLGAGFSKENSDTELP